MIEIAPLEISSNVEYTVYEMARKARPDWPGALHHVMVRGIDGRAVFKSAADRDDISGRLAELIPETDIQLFAWVVMPNHFHLLTRSGHVPLSHFMHRLLTGYSLRYNKLRERRGHVFQGRFKSILVEGDSYQLTLIRYIHLNPLKAGLVSSLRDLSSYRWSGHNALLLKCRCEWQQTEAIHALFGQTIRESIRGYLQHLSQVSEISDEVLLSGNRIIGKDGITPASDTPSLDPQSCCCRVLGSKAFAMDVMDRLREAGRSELRERGSVHQMIEKVIRRVSNRWKVTPEAIRGGARSADLAEARAVIARVLSRQLGLSHSDCGRYLGLSRSGVRNAIERVRDEDCSFTDCI